MTTLDLHVPPQPATRPAQFSYKQHELWPTEVWYKWSAKFGRWNRLTTLRSEEEARAMVDKLRLLP